MRVALVLLLFLSGCASCQLTTRQHLKSDGEHIEVFVEFEQKW